MGSIKSSCLRVPAKEGGRQAIRNSIAWNSRVYAASLNPFDDVVDIRIELFPTVGISKATQRDLVSADCMYGLQPRSSLVVDPTSSCIYAKALYGSRMCTVVVLKDICNHHNNELFL